MPPLTRFGVHKRTTYRALIINNRSVNITQKLRKFLKSCNFCRYVLQFRKDTKEEIAKRKEEAMHTLVALEEKYLEVSDQEIFPAGLELAKRQPWNFEMSKSELEMAEQKYFRVSGSQ